MNDPRNFDELARRKLDERSFPFEAAHWAGVEGTLNARRNGRRRWWWIPAAALLIITAALWFNGREVSTPSITTVPEKVSPPAERIAGNTQEHPQQTTTDARPEPIGATTEEAKADVSIPNATSTPAALPPTSAQRSKQLQVARLTSTTPHHPNRMPEKVEVAAMEDGIADKAAATGMATRLVTTGASEEKNHVNTRSNAVVTASAASDPSSAIMVDAGSTSIKANGKEDIRSLNAPVIPVNGRTEQQDNGSNGPEQTRQDPDTTSANTDATVHEIPRSGLPSDSSGSAMPPVTQPAPRAISKWNIELSLLGGALSTQQAFTPAAMLDDRSHAEGTTAPAGGAEAMWLKPHWGFGLGIHYTTLAERINSDRLESSATSIHYNYAVQSVETTLVVVTGSYVLDSVIHYTTTTKDTILHVLTIDRDTVTSTFQKRAARETRNTLSYWEVPLLLDAHTVSGRFTFGVRGGPTVGFLQENHGILPNATEDGYTELQRQQLRSTVLGYQARAYVRYRLCNALSIGVEPMVRGQIQSLFGDALPVSKASSLGAYFSVTYHLR